MYYQCADIIDFQASNYPSIDHFNFFDNLDFLSKNRIFDFWGP